MIELSTPIKHTRDDKADFRDMKRRADNARDFPTHTDPCSRHAYLMAENMVKKRGYPMLADEPLHCAISIMATVAALWETRAKLAAIEKNLPHLLSPQSVTIERSQPGTRTARGRDATAAYIKAHGASTP